MNFAQFLTQTSSENNNSCDYYTQLVQTKFNTGTSHPGNHCSSLSQVECLQYNTRLHMTLCF